MNEEFYKKQIKGLILVMQQVEGGEFVSRKYVIEKLNMILNGGIGFHPTIEERLNIQEYKEKYCSECDGQHTCVDLDGDLIDEQVKICMDKNEEILEEFL